METKTVKISEGNYRRICEYAGELQKERGKPVSVDTTLSVLLQRKELSDLAGSWKMNEKEVKKIFKNVRKGWNTWKRKGC